MRYISTKGHSIPSIEDALFSGTSTDGGLVMPESIPEVKINDFSQFLSYQEFSHQILLPYFAGSSVENELEDIVNKAFNFPLINKDYFEKDLQYSVLELFHGPTAAFKDFGARFLSFTMSEITKKNKNPKTTTILVATSGDTGGAVASAFDQCPEFKVVVLFPEGRVSPRQKHQLTCWGDHVTSIEVKGEFDDCQRLVKEAFSNNELSMKHNLCSANSINIGRLLPQATYYAWSSLKRYKGSGDNTSFIVPTGNLGNAFACFIAKEMGFPIDQIIFATNSNKTISDFISTGQWEPRATLPTLASAMDVGNPSNMERFFHFFDSPETLIDKLQAVSVTDEQIIDQIRSEYQDNQILCCPHTATALHVYRGLCDSDKKETHWCIAATAHPSKFENIVEPIIGEEIMVPEKLRALLELDSSFVTIDPELNQLVDIIASA